MVSDDLTPREIFDKTIPTPEADESESEAPVVEAGARIAEPEPEAGESESEAPAAETGARIAEPEPMEVEPDQAEPQLVAEPTESAKPAKSAEPVEEPEEPEEAVGQSVAALREPPDDGIKRRWYAIHAHSGQEANVQKSLQVQSELAGLQDMITNILVPMEEVAEFKSGEKKISKRKYFPGYVLVQLPEHPEKEPDLWHLIKDTPGVTGFIGSRTEPVPLDEAEVTALIEEIRGERERPKQVVLFDVGERVKVIDGPFANFLGNIDHVNADRGKLKVLIEIFERETSVEVEFWQVEKV